jgi:thymidylate synthase
MNNLDTQYQELLKDILENGTKKETRNGGTISLFGKQIRHKMSDGFPLLTTKKMYTKGIITELLWFLRGDTNIKYLVDNDCNIWVGDAYKFYHKEILKQRESQKIEVARLRKDGKLLKVSRIELLSIEEFTTKIKTDDEFAKKWGNLGPIYGKQWRSWNGEIDQIQNLINDLKKNPDSRRLLLTAWNPAEVDKAVLPPCHYGFQLYTRELTMKERLDEWAKRHNGRSLEDWDAQWELNTTYEEDLKWFNIPTRAISLMWNQRSCDVPLGIPYNIASYGILLSLFGKIANMIPDELIGNLGDCHIYLNQIDGCKEQITREPYELPTLNINTEFWPTETFECGIGPLHSDINVLNENMLITDFTFNNYQSHPSIKFPLSN